MTCCGWKIWGRDGICRWCITNLVLLQKGVPETMPSLNPFLARAAFGINRFGNLQTWKSKLWLFMMKKHMYGNYKTREVCAQIESSPSLQPALREFIAGNPGLSFCWSKLSGIQMHDSAEMAERFSATVVTLYLSCLQSWIMILLCFSEVQTFPRTSAPWHPELTTYNLKTKGALFTGIPDSSISMVPCSAWKVHEVGNRCMQHLGFTKCFWICNGCCWALSTIAERIHLDMRCCLNLLRECYYPFWAEVVKFTCPKSPQQNASPSVFDTFHWIIWLSVKQCSFKQISIDSKVG